MDEDTPRSLTDRLHSAIRTWQDAVRSDAHPKVVDMLNANVTKLMEEKKREAKGTEDTTA